MGVDDLAAQHVLLGVGKTRQLGELGGLAERRINDVEDVLEAHGEQDAGHVGSGGD